MSDHRRPILREPPGPPNRSAVGCALWPRRSPQGPLRRLPAAVRTRAVARPPPSAARCEADAAPRRSTRCAPQPATGDAAALRRRDPGARGRGRASAVATGLTPVINATGVVLHTGLGRAPLPAAAARAAARAARSYTDLEVDRETGGRGRRSARAEALLTALTGAEAALVVNNCAAALLLALATLAQAQGGAGLARRADRDRRGVPDPRHPGASGAKLVEVGTTNRTRIARLPGRDAPSAPAPS